MLSGPTARAGVERAIVLITDGQQTGATDGIEGALSTLRGADVFTTVVAVGPRAGRMQLDMIAGSPDRIVKTLRFSSLGSEVAPVRELLCPARGFLIDTLEQTVVKLYLNY